MKKKKPKDDRAKDDRAKEVVGPMQAVAGNLTRWIMILGIGLGVLGATAVYMGLLVVASMLVSIVFVAFTLYLFLRLWPEQESVRQVQTRVQTARTPVQQAMVSAVRTDGPPKARVLMALREMVKRQESFRISQQGAEMFAKTIRFMLRNDPSR